MSGLVAVDSKLFECARLASTHWCLSLAIFFVLLCPLTFLITSITSYVQRKSKNGVREPPMYPYWIPVLGHVTRFVSNRMGFFGEIK
jgi:hypothetical protein